MLKYYTRKCPECDNYLQTVPLTEEEYKIQLKDTYITTRKILSRTIVLPYPMYIWFKCPNCDYLQQEKYDTNQYYDGVTDASLDS